MKTRLLIIIGIALAFVSASIIIMIETYQGQIEWKEKVGGLTYTGNLCDEKYLLVGNDECVLNPAYVEPNTIVIYDVFRNSGTRLAIAPHHMVMNLTGSDAVVFVNEAANPVNIFVSDGATAMPLFGNSPKNILSFDNVMPLSQRTLAINGTGYYQFLIQDSRHGRTGEIIALSDDSNSLPVEIKAKMAQTIVGSDFRKDVGLISVGSGGAEPGITIGIHEKFKEEPNAEQFYYEKYKNMIPFDVPIWIRFHAPAVADTG